MLLAAVGVILLILIGLPIAFALGGGAFIAFSSGLGNYTEIVSVSYHTVDSFPLLAIPFFMLTGTIMNAGGLSQKLINFVSAFVGWFKGGLGVTLLGASALFGAISGSSIATVSAMGSIMTPQLVERGYPRPYVGGITAAAGMLGILIPPSIPMIVYGVSANVSIAEMFFAGLCVGLLLLAAMIVVNLIWAFNRTDLTEGTGRRSITSDGLPKFSLVNRLRKMGSAVPALALPVIILGGIYAGVFTPTEAGAVACVYGLLIGLFIYRQLRFSKIGDTLLEGALATMPILLIIALGGAFARAVTLSGIPFRLTDWIAEISPPAWLFLIFLNMLLLIVGCFIEENTAIIILTPLLLPLITSYGMDPIQFGVIMVLNLGIGLLTPPLALNVFVAARACEVPFHQIVKTSMRFLVFAALPVLLAVNVFPGISLWHAGQ